MNAVHRGRRALRFIVPAMALVSCVANAQPIFTWEELPPLPVSLTGHFTGVYDGALVVAGGASGDPIRPTPRDVTYYDVVYVFEGEEWREIERLPSPRAFGASATTEDGVWLVGGTDGTQFYSDLLRVRKHNGEWILDRPSPFQRPTPTPTAFGSAAAIDKTLYVFGGLDSPLAPALTNHFWSLDLGANEAEWQALDPGPVSPRLRSGLAARDDTLFLLGGADREGQAWRDRSDAFRYDAEAGWQEIADLPTTIEAPAAVPFGVAHVLVLGSKDAIAVDPTLPEGASARSSLLLGYHDITDSWGLLDTQPLAAGARPVGMDDSVALIGGYNDSGAASAGVYRVAPAPRGSRFNLLDYAALSLYFAVLIWMGLYFSRREKSTEAFFLGGRRIPWWAVGISIFGTSLSAITYISIPATAYTTNWVFILNNLGIIFLAPFIVAFYMPRLRQAPITTAYEYLERRFNLLTRIYGSLVFATFQIGRMAIVLYLPAIALSASTGLDITFCILAMGLLATLYTVLGGIEAVIWTDVIQSVVLVFGAILAFVLIVLNIDGGFSAMIATASEAGKFHTFDWSWDVTMASVWVALIGGIFSNAYPSMADQTVVQRYLSTFDAKEASKAVWTNALLTLPIQLLFFGLGTALWVFFKSHPNLLDPTLQHDAILPLFVVEMFPPGLRGVLIAGLFAASMSSLDSSMNSLSAVITHDYYRRFRRRATEQSALRFAKILTLLFGLFGTLSALYVATISQTTLFTLFLQFLGLVGGGLAGIFVLGVLTKRANAPGALLGALLSGAATYYAQTTSVHFFLYGMIGFLTSLVVGYLASRVIGLALGE